jgi:hypothetical protein
VVRLYSTYRLIWVCIAITGGLSSLAPKVGKMTVLETTKMTVFLGAETAFHNPTEYSAIVPYADLYLYANDTMIGNVTVRNIKVKRGQNENIPLQALWTPFADGAKGRKVARDVLSQFVSGMLVCSTNV